MKKGKFITFYGINNIGKTTHAIRLVNRLNAMGLNTIYRKYPKYDLSPSGPYLNRILRKSKRNQQPISEEELQMWFTINRYQCQPELSRLLAEGKIIVAEDYTGTGLAWGWLKGANLQWLEEMNKYLLKEDLAVLLEGKRTMRAKEEAHIHEAHDELVEKSKKVHHILAKKYGWKIVDLEKSKDATFEKVWEVVEKFLK
ncbi:hypothetical protein HZA39_03205 [Candidatus Peregrinibacteria bacterium]|nr:hypothetical protein [Candidatus Peregrinibacteria bacterium]